MMVFDSSALLAHTREETGADFVGELLYDADVPKFIHAANLCEVFHQTWRVEEEQGRDGQAGAEQAISDVQFVGVVTRRDMDDSLLRDAGELIARRRLAGGSLPLGDALGVALARRLEAQFITADRGEIAPLETAGLVNALFIR